MTSTSTEQSLSVEEAVIDNLDLLYGAISSQIKPEEITLMEITAGTLKETGEKVYAVIYDTMVGETFPEIKANRPVVWIDIKKHTVVTTFTEFTGQVTKEDALLGWVLSSKLENLFLNKSLLTSLTFAFVVDTESVNGYKMIINVGVLTDKVIPDGEEDIPSSVTINHLEKELIFPVVCYGGSYVRFA